MAEEKYTYKPEDIEIYRPIALAPEFFEKFIKEKDIGPLEKVILKLFENLGVKEERHRKGLAESVYATSPEGLQRFIKDNIENRYQKALNDSKLKELRDVYSDLFEKFYEKENLPRVNKVFNSDETYGSFMERYKAIVERAQSDTDNFSDEQKKKAKEELKELNKIALPLQEFELIKIGNLRNPINEESLRKRLNDMYKEKPKEETESPKKEYSSN